MDDRDKQALERYITSYTQRKLIQSPDDAGSDPQLATIVIKIAETISQHEHGALIDLGCGHGTFLKRISELPAFRDNSKWVYVAIDEDEKLDEVARLSRKLGVGRRVEPVPLKDFYKTWPEISSNQVLFCRNVLHELSISQTSRLLRHTARNFKPNDLLIIQDLMRFPESERHHVCWLPDKLERCLVDHGFLSVTTVPQGTRSGNAWFNQTAYGCNATSITQKESNIIVTKARQEQWKLWSALDTETEKNLPNRSELIQALDLDLQLVSLTRMLQQVGAIDVKLDPTIARRIRQKEFAGRIDHFVKKNKGLRSQDPVKQKHFRERGNQLDEMEAFLRSTNKVSLVFGGAGTGKTSFVNHLLDGRIYGKSMVWIDGRSNRSFWSIVEQIFAQSGLHISSDLLSATDELPYDSVKSAIGKFLNKYSSKMIIVVDNFDQFIDSNGYVIDRRIENLLKFILSKNGIKIISTSRADFLPQFMKSASTPDLPVIVQMGRFVTKRTVENVLDDYFDRASSGVQNYPSQLIDAIDRHPLIATLAGQVLGQNGKRLMLDTEFISEVRRQLRNELTDRLVDDKSRQAVETSSKLRVAVPSELLKKISSEDSIYHAKVSEVLYSIPDRIWKNLLTTLGLFRLRTVSDLTPSSIQKENQIDKSFHETVADAYLKIYYQDDDPKWIRESHYHRMLSGHLNAKQLAGFAGKYYVPELISSAIYCFKRQKNYKSALELFDAAQGLSKLDEQALMWRASCLIRIGETLRGEEEFRNLIENYPKNRGIKTSHIDALLHTNDWLGAKTTLENYALKPEQTNWIANQWGRVYLGLHRYDLCIPIFQSLVRGGSADPHSYVYLARAHQQFGDLKEAINVLRSGKVAYPSNEGILTSLGADLERAKQDDEALAILEPVFVSNPTNARAALGIIRVKLRDRDMSAARRILRRAEKHAVPALEWAITTANAEVIISNGDPKLAAHFLRENVGENESLYGLMLEAYTTVISNTDDIDAIDEIAKEVAEVKLPSNMDLNVPMLVTRANYAIAAKEKSIFDCVVDDLASTKIDPSEIERLRQKWRIGFETGESR